MSYYFGLTINLLSNCRFIATDLCISKIKAKVISCTFFIYFVSTIGFIFFIFLQNDDLAVSVIFFIEWVDLRRHKKDGQSLTSGIKGYKKNLHTKENFQKLSNKNSIKHKTCTPFTFYTFSMNTLLIFFGKTLGTLPPIFSTHEHQRNNDKKLTIFVAGCKWNLIYHFSVSIWQSSKFVNMFCQRSRFSIICYEPKIQLKIPESL